jgi:hypothetical protein
MTVTGVFFDRRNSQYELFDFTSPSEAFRGEQFTILGASVENNLVMVGVEYWENEPLSGLQPNILSQFVYDDPPRGDLLFILTNESGVPISFDNVEILLEIGNQ